MEIKLKPHSQIKIEWKTNSYDYSKAKLREIEEAFAKKYGIDRKCVKAFANFITIDNSTGKELTLQEDVIGDIQSPEFQKSLFEPYLKFRKVENYDLNALFDIDNEVNSHVDFQGFEKKRTYKLLWLKWDNFGSYGPDNYFDFRTLQGLTLLNSNPANQGGKTTFTIELLHFLFFGKTRKFDTQDQFFNYFLPEATTLNAEACIEIEGEQYVIKRTLKRPALAKRTEKSKTTSSLEYYKVAGEELISLKDSTEVLNGESVGATNQIIKDAVGRESDFDLVICATARSLEDLIEQEKTERGRLLARWVGLAPLEEKERIAKELYSAKTKSGFYSNTYSAEALKNDNETLAEGITSNNNKIAEYDKTINDLRSQVENQQNEIERLSNQRMAIDTSVEQININSCQTRLENVTDEGKLLTAKLTQLEKDIQAIGDIVDNSDEYKSVNEQITNYRIQLSSQEQEITRNNSLIKSLKEGEYCPTCHRKYDNVDNGPRINELTETNISLSAKITELKSQLDSAVVRQGQLKEGMDNFNRKSKLEGQKVSLTMQRNDLRNEYKEITSQISRYQANKDAIETNTRIAGEINLVNVNIATLNRSIESNIRLRSELAADSNSKTKTIEKNNDIIKRIGEEEIFMRNWKMYIDIIGKNGISKMVLRKALPVINANLDNLLDGACDFSVELDINEKNEVQYYILKQNGAHRAILKSGSGLESTIATLALRTVLFNISALSKPNFIILDEILGAVAKENYEKVHDLYRKIESSYDFIIQITHLDEVKDWHKKIITVNKVNDISKLTVESLS